VYKIQTGQNNHGSYDTEVSQIWILRLHDRNGNSAPDTLQAIMVFSAKWDNNSNGDWDTQYTTIKSIFAVDWDEDGDMERAVLVSGVIAISDDDGDDNLEWQSTELNVHTKNKSLDDSESHVYLFHSKKVQSNVSSSGIAQYENSTLIAYESWNTSTQNETHAIHYNVEKWDYDRDGIVDSETVHIAEDNRN
jgi:hypothetical protein